MSRLKKKDFEVRLYIPEQRIIDLFISACEGGSNYWCKSVTPKGRGDAYRAMLAGFTCIEMDERDESKNKVRKVSPEQIQAGIEIFAAKNPRHFGDFMSENDDAETADVFFQCVVLGECIYG